MAARSGRSAGSWPWRSVISRACTAEAIHSSTSAAERGSGDRRCACSRRRRSRSSACSPHRTRRRDPERRGRWQVYARRMPDEADELILKMQHLEAQARAQREARDEQAGAERVKSAAERLASESRKELEEAEAAARAASEKEERARAAGVPPLEAADLLVAARSEAQEARSRAVKARARLNYAL